MLRPAMAKSGAEGADGHARSCRWACQKLQMGMPEVADGHAMTLTVRWSCASLGACVFQFNNKRSAESDCTRPLALFVWGYSLGCSCNSTSLVL
jgi:hypothetical protein